MIGLYRVSLSAARPIIATAGRRAFQNTARQLKSISNDAGTKVKVEKVAESPIVREAAAVVEESAISKLKAFPKENPFVFQLIVATLKTVAADLTAQVVAEGKSWSEIDWKRNGIFVVFGFAYLGGFQYWIMVNKYRQWFPTMDKFAKMPFAEKLKFRAGLLDAGKMVLFDIFIHLPLMYFPSYYAVKEFVSGKTWNPKDWVVDGVTKYRNNMKEDLTAMVKLWGPSDCIQFVLPIHMRMPFRHMVSFFWTAYVSFTRGAIKKD